MDKAVIFGAFDFVSFHVCKTLLNKGFEVNGIHIEEKDKTDFLADKRLEVGRNANFSEQSLIMWGNNQDQDNGKTMLIFSIYDLYMLKKETLIENGAVMKAIIHYIERNENNTDLAFILPIQMLSRTFKERRLEGFIDNVKGLVKNTRLFYLPSIYGPWQPSVFLFQQAISSKFQKADMTIGDREWTNDTLFIDDAAESICEIIESGKPGSYLLESGRKNHWFKCAAYLNVDGNHVNINRSESIQVDQHIVKVSVNPVLAIEDSFTKQVEQFQNMIANRM
ncbi:hypothetical protein [Neobacillus soli]|uniref:hypothetical protein n=1 Tax=Neobacillus soli TaxID=220688 RepID=UPI000824DCDB|nr:hypothetical protein [Neobacillus soli]